LRVWRGAIVALGIGVSACSGGGTPRAAIPAIDRAVTITTSVCGDASQTRGTGVVVDEGMVLTAAHVVVGAGDVTVEPGSRPAEIIGLDTKRDLAALSLSTEFSPAVGFSTVGDGALVTVVGGAASGSMDVTVERHVTIDIDDVRGTERHERGGYVLAGRIAPGDSGAGLFSGDSLVGMVFAVLSDGSNRSYAVDSAEIEDFLTDIVVTGYECDPNLSRVVPVGGVARVP